MIRLSTRDARALVHYLEREWMPPRAREALVRLRKALEAENAAVDRRMEQERRIAGMMGGDK